VQEHGEPSGFQGESGSKCLDNEEQGFLPRCAGEEVVSEKLVGDVIVVFL
jgi:hypothetical protein